MTRGRCPKCGGEPYKRHCKIVCPQCGVLRDCSDPF
ncbi:Zn finger [Halorubrum tailed virus 25]|uniref:Zn finger n=1 Tax=Halorubrum tailed virus 25 TaxID=2878006 RepID=A0AAE9BYV7_9CAUD|nr:Zn finger [Halorubrum tailed virus 25]UBF22623.1 Zn finger [Halorubrum tailed virus 25]